MSKLISARYGSEAERSAVEARFAMRMSAALSANSDALPHDISERLRHAREMAVARAAQAKLAPVRKPVAAITWLQAGRSSAVFGQMPDWAGKLLSVLPAIALALGMLLIDELNHHEQIMAAVEVDTALLTDELPPDAYSDPGFLEFLKTSQP